MFVNITYSIMTDVDAVMLVNNSGQAMLPSNPLLASSGSLQDNLNNLNNGNNNGQSSPDDDQFSGNGNTGTLNSSTTDNGSGPPRQATTGTRCIIIQKDEKGFGLRVSGDNPVFVESVRPGKCPCAKMHPRRGS